ncbi:MAG TPA: GxxExxY protein [Stellaceae bacterium]|nr:GxxExxY protein [Stellaceae bacterium]
MIELSPEHDEIARQIVDSALSVHKALGPGLLESVYEQCLAYELRSRSLRVVSQVPLPVHYREVQIEIGFRIDLVVNDLVLIEVKAVERILAVHEAQLLTYLKLSGKHLGLLVNFNVPLIRMEFAD